MSKFSNSNNIKNRVNKYKNKKLKYIYTHIMEYLFPFSKMVAECHCDVPSGKCQRFCDQFSFFSFKAFRIFSSALHLHFPFSNFPTEKKISLPSLSVTAENTVKIELGGYNGGLVLATWLPRLSFCNFNALYLLIKNFVVMNAFLAPDALSF